ncbi:hypothetical protein [Stratiformator vulcanicus]|uniref:hypothetical protein n=1 Tax=Stratiformator vulcanicus TaxID=2527980 RepID=UPI0011AA06F5|nr:hypothetical protein [Stratiformator vulcanicus]
MRTKIVAQKESVVPAAIMANAARGVTAVLAARTVEAAPAEKTATAAREVNVVRAATTQSVVPAVREVIGAHGVKTVGVAKGVSAVRAVKTASAPDAGVRGQKADRSEEETVPKAAGIIDPSAAKSQPTPLTS